MVDVFFEKTRTCGGFSLIKHPKKCALFLRAAHRFTKLQIAAGVDVDLKILSVLIEIQRAEVAEILLLCFLHIG